MWLELFFRGIIVGVIATLPSVGPVGVLCIQRTISKSQRSGFISGMGAAVADTLFASVAFYSLTLVTTFIAQHEMWLKIFGGACILILGVFIFFKNTAMQIRRNRTGQSNLWQDFISVFLITLANPTYILVFVALFATFGLSTDIGEFNGVAMLTGVLAGATLWWFTLTFVVNLIRKKFRPRHLMWMNRIAGGLIILLGAGTILSSLVNLHLNVM